MSFAPKALIVAFEHGVALKKTPAREKWVLTDRPNRRNDNQNVCFDDIALYEKGKTPSSLPRHHHQQNPSRLVKARQHCFFLAPETEKNNVAAVNNLNANLFQHSRLAEFLLNFCKIP